MGEAKAASNQFVQMDAAPSSALHKDTYPNNNILPWYLLKIKTGNNIVYSLLTLTYHVLIQSSIVLIHIFLCLVLPVGTDDNLGVAAFCSNSVSTFILFSADIFFVAFCTCLLLCW